MVKESREGVKVEDRLIKIGEDIKLKQEMIK